MRSTGIARNTSRRVLLKLKSTRRWRRCAIASLSSRRKTRRCGKNSERAKALCWMHVLLIRHRDSGGGLFLRRPGCEFRAAHAQAAARVLPELLRSVQMADGAGGGDAIVAREFFGDVGEVERLFADNLHYLGAERRHRHRVAGLARRVFLAAHIVVDPGAVGI